MNKRRVMGLIRELLKEIGEDPTRQGLRKTPRRVAESMAFLTSCASTSSIEMDCSNMVFIQVQASPPLIGLGLVCSSPSILASILAQPTEWTRLSMKIASSGPTRSICLPCLQQLFLTHAAASEGLRSLTTIGLAPCRRPNTGTRLMFSVLSLAPC